MKRIYKMVIMSFIGPFVMTFFVVLFILLMQFLWKYINDLVGKGLEVKIIVELLLYASSGLVPLALPLAILLSSLMSFGSMGEYYELTAIKASGISLRRVMMPNIVIVIFISIGAFFFSNNVLPVTNLKMKSLLYDVRQQRPEVQITESAFYNGIENYSIRVDKKDPVTNLLYGIKIYDHSARKGNIKVTLADSGQIKMTADRRNMVITLWNGYSYQEREEGRKKKTKSYPHELDKFREQRTIIEVSGFELLRTDESIFKNSYQMLNVAQLQKNCDSLQTEINSRSRDFYTMLLKNNYFKFNELTLKSYQYTQPEPSVSIFEPVARATGGAGKRVLLQNGTPKESVTPDTSEPAVQAVTAPLQLKPVLRVHNFDSLVSSFNVSERLNIIRTASNYASMVQYQINDVTSGLDSEIKYLRRHEIEWHRKFTLSFACLIFLFIGAPLGAIIRKGGLGMPTVISTLLFILYYIISISGEKFVRESVLSSFQGMWLSSMVLVITGAFLTFQATNDSAILNVDTYIDWLREKTGLRKNQLLEKKSHITGKFELINIPKIKLQEEFASVSSRAAGCIDLLNKDNRWITIAHKSFTNEGLFYLVEFGIHYNAFMDQVILSHWFRNSYFKKRIIEFPYFNGRLPLSLLKNTYVRWIMVGLFPLFLYRMLQLKIKIVRLLRQLHQVSSLSSGMINLLNSSALKYETDGAL